jgi:hypothetical protein
MSSTTSHMHSSEHNEHYTPLHIIDAARATLGAIDLDPASCELANCHVGAARIFTRDDDGLSMEWGYPFNPSRVFCNPPGGKKAGESVQKRWWWKGAREWAERRVDALIWVAFKVDFLQTTQVDAPAGLPLPLDGAICYPRSRLAYLTNRLPGPTPKRPNRKPTKKQSEDFECTGLCTGESPPHASAIVYMPSRLDPGGLARFVEAFSPIGAVRVPFEARRPWPVAEAAE